MLPCDYLFTLQAGCEKGSQFSSVSQTIGYGIMILYKQTKLYAFKCMFCADFPPTPPYSCMKGYINDTLSIAHITDLSVRKDFFPSQLITESGFNVTQCRWASVRHN